jgi:hypothetical protein
MGFEIIWTSKAIQTFGKRIEYLEEHWTEKEIFNFTSRVNEYLETLKSQPLMFPFIDNRQNPKKQNY